MWDDMGGGGKQNIAEQYRIRDWEDHSLHFVPSYNITLDSFQPIVRLSREAGEHELAMMKWGLVPRWSKTSKATFRSINSRSDNRRRA
jgi:putative SOS response-associated peptidase YedK